MNGRSSSLRGTVPPYLTQASARSALRAPVHNPYDKFTQAEFDAWIGDITGALRRALGQEEPLKKLDLTEEDNSYDEEVGEDSFAELKARRAAKGKQRATYEDVDDDEIDTKEVESSILAPENDAEEDSVEYDSGDQWAGAHGRWTSNEEVSVDGSDGEDSEAVGAADEPIEILDDEDEESHAASPDEEEYEIDEESNEEVQPNARTQSTYEQNEDEFGEEEVREASEDNEVIEIPGDEDDEGISE